MPSKTTRRSLTINQSDLINRQIFYDPKSSKVSHLDGNHDLEMINQVTNKLNGLKESLESNILDTITDKMDYNYSFNDQKILDHNINIKGQPILYLQCKNIGKDKRW